MRAGAAATAVGIVVVIISSSANAVVITIVGNTPPTMSLATLPPHLTASVVSRLIFLMRTRSLLIITTSPTSAGTIAETMMASSLSHHRRSQHTPMHACHAWPPCATSARCGGVQRNFAVVMCARDCFLCRQGSGSMRGRRAAAAAMACMPCHVRRRGRVVDGASSPYRRDESQRGRGSSRRRSCSRGRRRRGGGRPRHDQVAGRCMRPWPWPRPCRDQGVAV